MAKDKVIHTRVSDKLHDRLSKSAEANGTTISGYSRKVLKNSVTNVEDPFKSDDFLHMAQWTFTVREECPEAHIFDVRHYLKIIKKYYPLLDTKFQLIFDNIIKDLKTLIKELNKWDNAGEELYYQFGEEGNELFIDYDELQKWFYL